MLLFGISSISSNHLPNISAKMLQCFCEIITTYAIQYQRFKTNKTITRMRKTFLFLAMIIGALTAYAVDYPYLTFETTDGAKISVEASSLNITISGTTLTAGDHTFTLVNLSKMYFSTSDNTTGIKPISAQQLNEAIEIFDLNGHKMQKKQLKSGVYVIKSKSGTHKIVTK